MKQVLFLSLLTFCLYGQTKQINGVVTLNTLESAENIHVLNVSSEKSSITNSKGEFTIEASEGDVLVFSAVHLDFWRQSVKQDDFDTATIKVNMTLKTTQLSEVVITDEAPFTAQSLGIINYTPKTMTVAQRRLNAAKSGGGFLSVDALLNWISGRTNKLKQNIALEKSERLRTRLMLYFNENYCMEHLKIPKDYVSGFTYFAIDDQDLVQYLEQKNQEMVRFLLADIAKEYIAFVDEYEKSFREN